MRIFFFLLFLTIILSLSPSSAGEDGFVSPSFVFAKNISENQRIESAVTHLVSLKEQKNITDNNLCGIDALNDFFGTPREIIISALQNVPCTFLSHLQRVVVFDDINKPRALAGATSLHLRFDIFDLPESEKVIIHELGHIVDLSGIQSKDFRTTSAFKDGSTPIYQDDPSVEFYSISWLHNTRWSLGTRSTDFVTGYAAVDPFEDFAESFLFYIKYGNTFRVMAKDYPQLHKKYEFLKTKIFDGQEFYTGDIPDDTSIREWDATKI